MLTQMISLVNLVYELVGNFGLAFFLFIVSTNLYHFHWLIPRKIRDSATPSLAQAKLRSLRVMLYSSIPLLILGFFVVGILIISGPALWIKVWSGLICLLILSSIFSAAWQFFLLQASNDKR